MKAAASSSPEQFERECRDLARNLSGDDGLSRHERLRRDRNVRRWVDKHSGMCKTLLSLDPLADATGVDGDQRRRRRRPQRRSARRRTHLGPVAGRRRRRSAHRRPRRWRRARTGSVGADRRSHAARGLPRPLDCETSEGQPVAGRHGARLVLRGNDRADRPRRRRRGTRRRSPGRLATRAQRRALRAMYRTCAHPDCTRGVRRVPHPPRHLLGTRRPHRPRQPDPAVRDATTTSSTRAAGHCNCSRTAERSGEHRTAASTTTASHRPEHGRTTAGRSPRRCRADATARGRRRARARPRRRPEPAPP